MVPSPAYSATRETALIRYFEPVAVLVAIPLAFVLSVLYSRFGAQPERGVLAAGGVLAIALTALGGGWAFTYRRKPIYAPLALLGATAVILVAVYGFAVSSAVTFPADILIWSESDFVNDIIKLRTGYPIYTADVNNDSFCYPFGTQVVTYALAWMAGAPQSVAAFRVIQLLYTCTAALIAFLCLKRIQGWILPDLQRPRLWYGVAFPFLLLVATNLITNPFTHNLHNDALAQLLNLLCFYLLLRYMDGRSKGLLAVMAVLPALGFLSKQSVLIWAGFFGLWLLLDRPVRWARVAGFGAAAAAASALVITVCFALWGQWFYYWTFTVLGSHGVSPLRAFRHAMDVWPYLAALLFGGWALLQAGAARQVRVAWLVSLLLLLSEVWTSGVAWMLNHIGPGSLLAGIWLLIGLMWLWRRMEDRRPAPAGEAAAVAGIVLAAFAGMGLIRIPMPVIPADAYRYLQDIEREFANQPRAKVLIDAGSWMYLPAGIVMKDRAPTIGERGYSRTGNFSGVLQRIRQKQYATILVRNYGLGDFWYDHESWVQPSGIRQALADSYRESHTIPAVIDPTGKALPYLFTKISVLVPKADAQGEVAGQ